MSRYRWTILALGTVAQASYSAVFLGIPVMAPQFRDEYGLSLPASRRRARRDQHRLGRDAPALGAPHGQARRARRSRLGSRAGLMRARGRRLHLRLRGAGPDARVRGRRRRQRERRERACGHELVPPGGEGVRARHPADRPAARRSRSGAGAPADRGRGRDEGRAARARGGVPGDRDQPVRSGCARRRPKRAKPSGTSSTRSGMPACGGWRSAAA